MTVSFNDDLTVYYINTIGLLQLTVSSGLDCAINRSKVYHFTLHRYSPQPQNVYKSDPNRLRVLN